MGVGVHVTSYQRVQGDWNGNAINGRQDEYTPRTQGFQGGYPCGNLQKQLGFGWQEDIVLEAGMG